MRIICFGIKAITAINAKTQTEAENRHSLRENNSYYASGLKFKKKGSLNIPDI